MGSGNPVVIRGPIDEEGAVVVIDYPHHEVHEARMFHASYKSPEGGDIVDNGTIILQITSGLRIDHLLYFIAAGGDTEVEFLEAPTTSGGTALQSHNTNRNGLMTPSSVVVHTPTVSAAGLLLDHFLVPGGIGANFSGGGSARRDTEWDLKPETKYVLRATNRSGGAQPMSLSLTWYEEEPK